MRNIIIILIVFFVIRYFRKRLQSAAARHGSEAAKGSNPGSVGQDSEDMVQDPVCGSYVPLSSAVTAEFDGRIEHFCGPECRDKYLKER